MSYGINSVGVSNIYGGKFQTGNAGVMACSGGTINLLGVSVRMINTKSGHPVEIISGTVTGAVLKNVTSSGCDIYIYTNNSNVTKVMFPTWTNNNGQDDIIWGTGSNVEYNVWYYRVNASSHGNEKIGYITHIYSYNSSGSVISSTGMLSGYNLE